MSVSANNKRIAKNTIMLYCRMAVTMGISLYTSRVILEVLGVDNFGIYNVVGGVVVLFGFLNTAMATATQRFLNFWLGKNDFIQTSRVFSMALSVHGVISVVILLLAETIGLWFLNVKLNIPADRMSAANWVYQFSVFTTILGIMLVPYHAVIVAYEKMSFYALMSIANAVLKLVIVYMLIFSPFDALVYYAFLVFVLGILNQIAYIWYSKKSFGYVAKYYRFWEANLFKELFGFSGWSLFGGVANMCNSQGINMVLNIFCGVVLNAAMGITTQIQGAVGQFVGNFQLAFSPQLTKLYAAGKQEEFIRLIFRASKFSYFLMFFIALPFILNMDFVLNIWLTEVPEYTSVFAQWLLVFMLIDALSGPLWMSVQARGKIKNYQLIVSCFIFLNLPLAILVLWLGFSPVWVVVIKTGINLWVHIWRIFYLRKLVALPARKYLWEVCARVFFVSVVSSILPLILWIYCSADFINGWGRFLSVCFVSTVTTSICVWLLGFNRLERHAIVNMFFSKFIKQKG